MSKPKINKLGLSRCSIMDTYSAFSLRQYQVLDEFFEGGERRTPEQNLMLAVIYRAFRDAVGCPNGDGQKVKIHPAEARNWFYSDEVTLFSFQWICEHLNLSSSLVKKMISTIREEANENSTSAIKSPTKFFQAKLDD